MRKYLTYVLCLVTILITNGSASAKDKFNVTILPFAVHSAENIDYVKNGIEEMLSYRISADERITVTNKSIVGAELKKLKFKDLTTDDIYILGKKLNSDYVVWGSITKIGNSISIDGKLIDIASTTSDVGVFTRSETLDDVIPKINDFSESVIHHILGTSPTITTKQQAASDSAAAVSRTPSAPLSRESQIIASMRSGGKKGGTLTSVINSEFINAPQPLNREGFWMSQNISTEFKGMDIGDVTNDGLNEVVAIDKNNVYIYRKTEKELKLLERIKGNSYNNYVSVDVADINRNGISEIIVTSLNGSLLDSFVLEYRDGKYLKIASDIRFFLRVIHNASGIPLLLGQEYGFGKPLDTPIFEIVWQDGKYVRGERMKIPLGLSIYGLALDNLGIGVGEKIFALDEYDYLYIIEKTTKPLSRLTSIGFTSDELIWRSDDVYGGSNNYIENTDITNPGNKEKSAYANLRILTFDTNGDGKKELILVKNLSPVGRMFKNYKLFTSSEIYNLEWDGLGMAENWKTKKINGYVADYSIKDIDNDGKPDIVLALVLSVGASLKNRSVIAYYKLQSGE